MIPLQSNVISTLLSLLPTSLTSRQSTVFRNKIMLTSFSLPIKWTSSWLLILRRVCGINHENSMYLYKLKLSWPRLLGALLLTVVSINGHPSVYRMQFMLCITAILLQTSALTMNTSTISKLWWRISSMIAFLLYLSNLINHNSTTFWKWLSKRIGIRERNKNTIAWLSSNCRVPGSCKVASKRWWKADKSNLPNFKCQKMAT